MKISALILARNEEEVIEECLKQLDFVDEIIVLDQLSTDNTATIAKKYATKVMRSSKKDFNLNRTILRDEAKGEWLLYVDCDEKITTALKEEILSSVKKSNCEAYYFPRENFVLGKRLKHGGWWPDYVPKLFKKSQLITWHGRVHESPEVVGKFGYLKNPLIHETGRTVSKMFQKSIKWAKIEAELSYKTGHSRITVIKTIKAAVQQFFSIYFVKLGILDGQIGLIEAVYQSLHRIMVLTYLWEIQNNTQEKLINFNNE